jgi:hypothetical protein
LLLRQGRKQHRQAAATSNYLQLLKASTLLAFSFAVTSGKAWPKTRT